MRTALIGGTLLAASAFGLYQCEKKKSAEDAARIEQMNADAFKKADEYSFYVTTGVTVDDIKKSTNIGDTLRQNLVQMFDVNNNGVFERSEANVFNSTRIIENPNNEDELILHTALKDGTTKESTVLRKDADSFKYKLDESLVANWRKLPVVKLLKNIDNIINPNIPTIANVYFRDNNSGKYAFAETETFEGNGNDRIYKSTKYYGDGYPYTSTEYRSSDATTITTHVYSEETVKEFFKNDERYRTETYINNKLRLIEENGVCTDYADGRLFKTTKDLGNDKVLVTEYYPNGRKKSEEKGYKDGDGKVVINDICEMKYYDEDGHLIKEIYGDPYYDGAGKLIEYYPNGKVKKTSTSAWDPNNEYISIRTIKTYDEKGNQTSCETQECTHCH